MPGLIIHRRARDTRGGRSQGPAAPTPAPGARPHVPGIVRAASGLGLLELTLVLLLVALVGVLLYRAYFAPATRTVETLREDRPLAQARLTADRATLGAIRAALQLYYGQHGRWPPDKAAVNALLNPPPAFQCAGNDYEYDPATGRVELEVSDPARC